MNEPLLVMATLASLALAVAGPVDVARAAERAIEAAVADPRRSDSDRERDKSSRPGPVLTFFGVEPRMRVLDLLSGGGYYTEILSYAVGPSGRIVAHTNDIHEKYHAEAIADRYRGDRLSNVERLISNPPDLNLGSAVFDLVLMNLTYHDIYYVSESNPIHPRIDRDRFLAQVRACLKPGGVLVVVDHSAKSGTGSGAAQELHRIDEDFAKEDIEAAGFSFEGESDALRNPDDDRTMSVFDDRIRRSTDRFVYRFVKPRSSE